APAPIEHLRRRARSHRAAPGQCLRV
ncbi:MAG: hypothetical protein AVDCRST_MAG45-2623, partial [uncultured Solirubrobacterales bacterium]